MKIYFPFIIGQIRIIADKNQCLINRKTANRKIVYFVADKLL